MKKSICFLAILVFCCMGINLYSLEEQLACMKRVTNALQQSDYYTAIAAQKELIILESRSSYSVDSNMASSYVRLAMLEWSVGNKENAKEAMRNAIKIMRTGKYIGNSGCEQRAEIFYHKMCKNQLPSKFTYGDMQGSGGVLTYIMEIPYAVATKKQAAVKARYDALTRYYGSMAQTYKMQGELQARIAKHYARSEYQQITNKSFSPNDPPAYGTRDREVWENCKKVYDIFE